MMLRRLMMAGAGSAPVASPVFPFSFPVAATNHIITIPASVVDGDVLVLCIASDGGSTASQVATPSGWVQLATQQEVNTSSRGTVLYRVAASSAGQSVDLVTSSAEEMAVALYVVKSAASPVGISAAFGPSGSSPVLPSVTLAWSGATRWIAFAISGRSPVITSGYPLPDDHITVDAASGATGAGLVLCAVAGTSTAPTGSFASPFSTGGSSIASLIGVRLV